VASPPSIDPVATTTGAGPLVRIATLGFLLTFSKLARFFAMSSLLDPAGIPYDTPHASDSSSLQKTKLACLRAALTFSNSN